MTFRTVAAVLAFVAGVAPCPARAWGADGHQTVGALADKLIAGTHAQSRVRKLLGGISLRDAAVWADCARGVDTAHGFAYPDKGKHPDCAVFESAAGIAEMQDFVRRNDTNCDRKPHEPSCHTQYHYTDIALQRDRYDTKFVGARDDDIVAAAQAAIRVLQGHPAPKPFEIKGAREALLMLAHYVGDIHQPLHVGAVYLDAAGKRIDPDPGPPAKATETLGGNEIIPVDVNTGQQMAKLHSMWDGIPAALLSGHIDAAWLAQARSVQVGHGDPVEWPAAWASTTLLESRGAHDKLKFSAKHGSIWNATLPLHYRDRMTATKKKQLTVAGARLAQVLTTVFP